MTVTVKKLLDHSPIADLMQPWKNHLRRDGNVCGAIELAYLRGFQAGLEAAAKTALSSATPHIHDD